MAGELLLDYYAKSLPAGCCPGEFYALVFNEQHQAIKDNGAGVLTFQDYAAASHDDFGIDLSEHAERTKYYSSLLDSETFSLPATPQGEAYTVEYWRNESSGDKDRDVDTLLETRELYWSGTRRMQARLDTTQVDALAPYLVHVSFSYDAELQKVYFLAWLEKNGVRQTDTQGCVLLWLDRTGEVILNTEQTTFLPNADGVFAWDEAPVDLDPDLATVVMATITDADGGEHETVSSIVTWD